MASFPISFPRSFPTRFHFFLGGNGSFPISCPQIPHKNDLVSLYYMSVQETRRLTSLVSYLGCRLFKIPNAMTFTHRFSSTVSCRIEVADEPPNRCSSHVMNIE
jgi:hypothetical protein